MNKASVSDGIIMEMPEVFDDFCIEKITEIINKIYDNGYITEDLIRPIFIALPKKLGENEYELH